MNLKSSSNCQSVSNYHIKSNYIDNIILKNELNKASSYNEVKEQNITGKFSINSNKEHNTVIYFQKLENETKRKSWESKGKE